MILTWYGLFISIFSLFAGYVDDISQVISNFNVQRSKFADKNLKKKKKKNNGDKPEKSWTLQDC